jgi:hypothetical protein
MGFNHKVAGFDNVEDFVIAMYESESKQFKAMLGYIKNATTSMVPALKKLGWETFARDYNGPGNVAVYGPKLKNSYNKFVVMNIQERLIYLSKKDNDVSLFPGKPDGVWGDKTKKALLAFQQKQGLSATGKADSVSIARLKSLVADILLPIA